MLLCRAAKAVGLPPRTFRKELVAAVVRLAAENRHRTVELFDDDDGGEVMRERQVG